MGEMNLFAVVRIPGIEGIDVTSNPNARGYFCESSKTADGFVNKIRADYKSGQQFEREQAQRDGKIFLPSPLAAQTFTCHIDENSQHGQRLLQNMENHPGLGSAAYSTVVPHLTYFKGKTAQNHQIVRNVRTNIFEDYLHDEWEHNEEIPVAAEGKRPNNKEFRKELTQRVYTNQRLAQLLERTQKAGEKVDLESQELRTQLRAAMRHDSKLRNPDPKNLSEVAFSKMAQTVINNGTIANLAQLELMQQEFNARMKKLSDARTQEEFEAERDQIIRNARQDLAALRKEGSVAQETCDAYNKFLAEMASYSSPMSESERVGLAMTGTLSAMAASAPSALAATADMKTLAYVQGIIDESSRETKDFEIEHEVERPTRAYDDRFRDSDGDGICNAYDSDPYGTIEKEQNEEEIDEE